jgi:iron-sulfur cluster repair protein YtfE (RIC family)
MERSDPRPGGTPAESSAAMMAGGDALGLLIEDHERVRQLFEQFDDADRPQKRALAHQICQELKIHAQIEEEIFYPATRQALDDEDLVDEAVEEHAEAKQLIARLEAAGADEAEVEATVLELREAIEHHVDEEEGEMFPQVRAAGVDLLALGEQLADRKRQLKTSGL